MKKLLAVILTASLLLMLGITAGAENAGTAVFNGKEYTLLTSIACSADLALTDAQFDEYFEGGAEAGVRAISKAGNVFINHQPIPYLNEAGELGAPELPGALWQVEGGWAWKVHIQRQWADDRFMPQVKGEEDFVPGQPVDLETAAYKFIKYLTYVVGQTVELYALPGETKASLIATQNYGSTLVGSFEEKDGQIIVYSPEGEAQDMTFPVENWDPAIQAEDVIVTWVDYEKGNMARRANAKYGRLIENTDPAVAQADHHPWFKEQGSDALLSTEDSYIGKSFGEAYRHTQFIRGERRTDQYNYADELIIMWSSDDGEGHVVGFTRGTGAKGALQHAVAYAQAAVADVVVSEDGSDVPDGKYWVPGKTWEAFEAKLAEAEAMLAAGTAGNLAYDAMIYDLGNVLGGSEDLYSTSPLKMNPLGIVGLVQAEKDGMTAEEIEAITSSQGDGMGKMGPH